MFPANGRQWRVRALPLLIPLFAVALDQWSKARIVATIPLNTIGSRFMDDFLWIVHARNLGIAFSIGEGLGSIVRVLLFIIVPAFFIAAAIVFCLATDSLSKLQRIAVAFLIGGGAGNLIDRIFRPEGVVDFISFSLFGFLGLDRFPTFNVADTCVTIGAGLILLSGFFFEKRTKA